MLSSDIRLLTRTMECGNIHHKGMCNNGNYCYLNAVIQCLNHCPGLVEFQNSFDHFKLSPLKEHFKMMNQGVSTIKISPLYSVFSEMNPSMIKGAQNDSAEYFNNFLSFWEDIELDIRCDIKPSIEEQKTCVIGDMFGGIIQNGIRCLGCENVSHSYTHFFALPIKIDECESVWEALNKYSMEEILKDSFKCYCHQCKTKEKAIRISRLHKLPYYFTIQISRFGTNGEKIHKKIKIEETLNMFECQSLKLGIYNSLKEGRFELYGIVSHKGDSLHFGHYSAHSKCPHDQKWRIFNDSHVEVIHNTKGMLEDVSRTCTLLFYKEIVTGRPDYELEYTPTADRPDYELEYTPTAERPDYALEYTPTAERHDYALEYTPTQECTKKIKKICELEYISSEQTYVTPIPNRSENDDMKNIEDMSSEQTFVLTLIYDDKDREVSVKY
eukprot:GHVL01009023.1.p1 GENE.GHVL01009023.1~~GHVL01009023.1.p1  ORF type:complete len:441 (-),score=83.37 GHVL01009023.1:44-1366(-)